MSNGSDKRSTVDAVLYFDELDEQIVGPEPMEKAVFGAVAKAVPEYRRDMRVGLASLITWALTKHDYTPTDVASHLVVAPEEQWSSFSVPRLGGLISRTEVAYALLRGVQVQYLDDLDEILIEDFLLTGVVSNSSAGTATTKAFTAASTSSGSVVATCASCTAHETCTGKAWTSPSSSTGNARGSSPQWPGKRTKHAARRTKRRPGS